VITVGHFYSIIPSVLKKEEKEMKTNTYTNVILTVIAALLTLNLMKPVIFPTSLKEASPQGAVDINIAEVGGRRVTVSVGDMRVADSGIPVFLTK